ncbi:MAG: hypothetical protein JO097_18020 [Acidobacteriaceae bacterium]|nr:hypothetical protein [Acidobacteriaceae bacterium]MBV9296373.1 hypothetical protein [Acidobacteriaceae bacterium]
MYARNAFAIAKALAASDASNVQARDDLIEAWATLGDSFRSTQPATASQCYRKAIALTRKMADRDEARSWLSQLDLNLAAVLPGKQHLAERLNLLQEANKIRQELTSLTGPTYRLLLVQCYCTLSDAESEAGNLARAKQSANSALPFFSEFKTTSPSLSVVRGVGLCYESMGNLERRIATDGSLSLSQRHAAQTESQEWYRKSLDAWSEWNKRGAATPESELERRKVEDLLSSVSTYRSDRNARQAAHKE